MSLSVKKLVIYGGTILISLGLIALSILWGGYEEVRRGVFLHRGFGLFPFQGAVFVFGRHLPGWQGVISVIGAYLFVFLSGMVVLFLIPHQVGTVYGAFFQTNGRKSWKTWLYFLGVGILSLLALALLSGLGLVTDAAFPLPLFMLALLLLVILIGLITFGISWAGWIIGRKARHFFEIRIGIAGGLILLAIGFKILIQHLFF